MLWIFGSLSLLGFYAAYLYGRHTRKFRWREYAAMLTIPVACSIGLAYLFGPRVILFFLYSSVLGFILEYGVGFAYHKTLNRRLWTYSRLSINGYTSWLTLPIWGVAGVIFWLLSRSLEL